MEDCNQRQPRLPRDQQQRVDDDGFAVQKHDRKRGEVTNSQLASLSIDKAGRGTIYQSCKTKPTGTSSVTAHPGKKAAASAAGIVRALAAAFDTSEYAKQPCSGPATATITFSFVLTIALDDKKWWNVLAILDSEIAHHSRKVAKNWQQFATVQT